MSDSDENMRDFNATRNSLVDISKLIKSGDYPHNISNWGGADVVITDEEPNLSQDGFYPDPRFVVTQFSHELSWLFNTLKVVFNPYIDGCSKIEFYGRLANMAERYQVRLHGEEEQEQDLLNAVLHEAFSMLDEMEEGGFRFLVVAEGNTIFDDIIDRADSGGYLGVEKTRQYLEDLERRCQDVP